MGEPPKSHRKARSPEAASAGSHFPERTDQQTPPGSLVTDIFTHACAKRKVNFAKARTRLPTGPGQRALSRETRNENPLERPDRSRSTRVHACETNGHRGPETLFAVGVGRTEQTVEFLLADARREG